MFESRAFLSDLPVTLVTGYLGSGKTTYINERLSDANGVRYAVMVNDFGELNIDAELIAASTERTISLTNGCVCCSLADDMDAAMEQVQQLAHELDWVLFEASGVADPERIKTKIEARPGFALREFLTIIDVTRIKSLAKDKYIGQHIKRQLQLTHPSTPDSTNVQGIEYGTRLSKTDLLSAAAIADVQSWLAHFNSNNESDCDDAGKSDGMPRFFTRTVEKTGFLNREILSRLDVGDGAEVDIP
jgi:G3E family GTPase